MVLNGSLKMLQITAASRKWNHVIGWKKTRKKSVLAPTNQESRTRGASDDFPKPFEDIPGPKPSIPFIGNGWQYFPFVGRYSLFKLHEANVDKYRRFGRIVKEEYQWRRPIVQVFDPEDFEKVFRHQGKYPVRPVMDFVCKYRSQRPRKYESSGLANSLGEEWSRLRSNLSPVLSKMKESDIALRHLSEITEDMVRLIKSSRSSRNSVENMQDLLYKVALECIFMMCLNERLGCLEKGEGTGQAGPMIQAAKDTFDAYQKLYYGVPLWKIFATPAYKQLDRAECTIYQTVSSYMSEALREKNFVKTRGPVLDSLLSLDTMSDQEKTLTIVDFILGGVFTVTNSLCYLLYHLAKNKNVQDKLYDEVSRIATDKIISNDQMSRMKYLKACVKETFRISPTVPGIMRILPRDVTLSGYNVPAGTAIFCHFMVTCKLDQYFERANEFVPERWLRSNDSDANAAPKSNLNPFTLLPFGFGSRMCAGRTFSHLELCVTAAKVVQSFRMECDYPTDDNNLNLKHAFIVVPSKPIVLKFIDR